MKTKWWAFSLMVLCTLLTSTAQIFYKKGAADLSFNIASLATNYNLIAGMIIYIVGAFLMITAFRGGEVTVLYPIIATSYVWVSISSIFFLGESMNLLKWLGIITIIAGIILVGFGSKGSYEISKTPSFILIST